MGLTLEITGLNEPLKDFDGSPLVLRLREGNLLTEPQQLTLGEALLNLLGVITEEDPKQRGRILLLGYATGQKIAEAMETDLTYTAGEAALGVLRKAAEQNMPGYIAKIIAQVYLALGMGE